MTAPRPWQSPWRTGAARLLGYQGVRMGLTMLRLLRNARERWRARRDAVVAPMPTIAPTTKIEKCLYTAEHATQFPLCFAAHDVGLRYLFDFTVAALSLGLRPGARVLDFAAGPAYVSELLNRLGYFTVGLDWDRDFLALARQRLTLDSRCEPSRANFTAGDGTCLPFRDASFDGIVCMNALHHMPDYRQTLAEMCRVLRPGGRAVFSEPGSQHSRAPESIVAMREQGVLERDVVLSDVYRMSTEVGFERLVLKPYVYPDAVNLDYRELRRFGRGKRVSTPFLSAGETATYVEQSHPLFYLEKPGAQKATSATASAQLLRARLTVGEIPAQTRAGSQLAIRVGCQNVGQSTWLAHARPLGGYVTFGVKVLTSTGRLVDDGRGRTLLTHDVPPGGRAEAVAQVDMAGLPAGHYQLLFDMVNEQVCWFTTVGSEPVVRKIDVV